MSSINKQNSKSDKHKKAPKASKAKAEPLPDASAASTPGEANQKQKRGDVLTVFVGNLPRDIGNDELKAHFNDCGPIEYARVDRDTKTFKSKGCGYVKFKTREGFNAAVAMNEKTMIQENTLRVFRATNERKLDKLVAKIAKREQVRKAKMIVRMGSQAASEGLEGGKTEESSTPRQEKLVQRDRGMHRGKSNRNRGGRNSSEGSTDRGNRPHGSSNRGRGGGHGERGHKRSRSDSGDFGNDKKRPRKHSD